MIWHDWQGRAWNIDKDGELEDRAPEHDEPDDQTDCSFMGLD